MSPSASSAEVKAAYHRALLLHHPDKAFANGRQNGILHEASILEDDRPSVSLIRDAYITLSNAASRATYDATVRSSPKNSSFSTTQRPAEVVSLEEFKVVDPEDGKQSDSWSHPCRCGSTYRISEEQMNNDVHLIGCQGCSEAVWVGYEVIDE